jgi:hypothetical protein
VDLIASLIDIIDQHGFTAVYSQGRLWACSEVREPDGIFKMNWEQIEPTYRAVKRWLGY